MFKLKQSNYILFLSFFFLQQSICSACDVTFFVNTDPPSCVGKSDGKITITVNQGISPFLYSFDGGSTFLTENFITNLTPGDYNVVVQDADGCERTRNVTISESNTFPLEIDLGEDLSIQLGEIVEIDAQILGSYNGIEWNSLDTNANIIFQDVPHLYFSPLNSQTIFIIVNENNCYSIDSIHIEVKREDNIFIPNAFTPNGDGFNDRFNIYAGISVAKINKLQILDNWGNVVFEKINYYPNDPYHGWDGTVNNIKLNPNIFVYCSEVEYLDGTTKTFCGDVLLLN